MEFWIKYVDKNGCRHKRRFGDKTQRDYFVANWPSGVARIVEISEDLHALLPMNLPFAKSITDLRSQEPEWKEDSQEYPACINSVSIQQAWAKPSCRLSESFSDPVKAATVLIERYKSGWAIETLAREFHTSRKTIKNLLIENWIQPRRRRFRNLQDARPGWEEAFSKATPEALYWAGFLMADGSIGQEKGETKVACWIGIFDSDHIRKLCDFVGRGTPTISEAKRQSRLVGWQVHSRRMADDLARWGIVPGKGKHDDLSPKAEARMSAEFWRGMIDGDGSIGTSRTTPQVQLTGRWGISEAFIEFVEASMPLQHVRRRDPTTGRLAKKIRIHKYPKGGGTKVILNGPNAVALCQLLYVSAPKNLCLSRKRDAALEIIKHYLGRNAVKQDHKINIRSK